MPALLFDLDGTLVHSDPAHFQAWREILAQHHVALDEDAYRRRISGRTNPEIVQSLLPELSPAEGDRVAEAKEMRFRELAGAMQPVAGLTELVERARRAGCKLALVTNAPRANATMMLGAVGLQDAFSVCVLADEVGVGKPDPMPYLHAMAQLGAHPDTSYAFEDSASGVRSAVAAGLRVAGLCGTHTAEMLASVGADPVVPDFTAPELLAALAHLLGDA